MTGYTVLRPIVGEHSMSRSSEVFISVSIKVEINSIVFLQDFVDGSPFTTQVSLRGIYDNAKTVEITIGLVTQREIQVYETLTVSNTGSRSRSYELFMGLPTDEYKDLLPTILTYGSSVPLTVEFDFLKSEYDVTEREAGVITLPGDSIRFYWKIASVK